MTEQNNKDLDYSNDIIDDIKDSDTFDDIDDLDDIGNTDDNDMPKKNKKATKNKKSKLQIFILVISIAVFLFSAFELGTILYKYWKNEKVYNALESEMLVESEDNTVVFDAPEDATDISTDNSSTNVFKYDHAKLLETNSDGIGYIDIPSVDIRLPLVQGQDNQFYLNHLFDKSYNGGGCVFEDCNIKGGISASHVILYGHHLKNGGMFAKLQDYLDPDFYSGHEYFYIYTGNQVKKYQIFSVHISKPYGEVFTFNFPRITDLQGYALSMKDRSVVPTNVNVDGTTQVVTLCTCTGDGKNRIIVQGSLCGEAALNN